VFFTQHTSEIIILFKGSAAAAAATAAAIVLFGLVTLARVCVCTSTSCVASTVVPYLLRSHRHMWSFKLYFVSFNIQIIFFRQLLSLVISSPFFIQLFEVAVIDVQKRACLTLRFF